ncbi:MAG: DUF1289 domain-containing protein [Gemmatimonadaceae bacterium]|nr:DUF1289 domain-containing protein [Gemmatimonadaceae bacterium]
MTQDSNVARSATTSGRATSESPCIKVCQVDLDDRCRGCGRTLDEISRWSMMSIDERIAVNRRVGFVSHERQA